MKPRVARFWTEQLLFGGFVRKTAARSPAPFLRTFFTAGQPAAHAKFAHASLQQSALVYLRLQRSAIARRFRTLRFKTDKATSHQLNPTPHLGSPEPALSLSQRLKKLSREYGWSAVGVYFALSVLDFPFCFLAVRLLGTDRIGRYEAVLKNGFWSVVRIAFPNAGPTEKEVSEDIAEATAREGHVGGTEIDIGPGADASIWTQLGLAYLVHKSFIFVRVPLTAAVLPKVVKTLRSWGYDIGKKKAKKVKNIKPA